MHTEAFTVVTVACFTVTGGCKYYFIFSIYVLLGLYLSFTWTQQIDGSL